MTRREEIAEECGDDDLLFVDPASFDEAIIGVADPSPGREQSVVYDREAVIDVLEREGMSREEAEEHFQFNIVGAWVGDRTPIFVTLHRKSLHRKERQK